MNPRIITGSAKGQKLEVPRRGTRPMTDRTKSALFSMIMDFIPDADVLDLYAGTGALGIECLSRGSKSAIFVDRSKFAIFAINKNLDKTGFSALGKVIKSSVLRFLNNFEDFNLQQSTFDIIFITPPHDDYRENVIEVAGPFVKKDGIIIVEHSSRRKTSDRIAINKMEEDKTKNLEKVEERSYGRTSLSFYKKI